MQQCDWYKMGFYDLCYNEGYNEGYIKESWCHSASL